MIKCKHKSINGNILSEDITEFIGNIIQGISNTSINELPKKDRALLYAIQWCNSTKANLSKYTCNDLLVVASRFKNFLEN